MNTKLLVCGYVLKEKYILVLIKGEYNIDCKLHVEILIF